MSFRVYSIDSGSTLTNVLFGKDVKIMFFEEKQESNIWCYLEICER